MRLKRSFERAICHCDVTVVVVIPELFTNVVCTLAMLLPRILMLSQQLKLPSLFAARFFWTFHNKLHNMKALVILSHRDHHFSYLLVFMKKENFCGSLWALLEYFREKTTSHSSLLEHRCSYRDLCPNF